MSLCLYVNVCVHICVCVCVCVCVCAYPVAGGVLLPSGVSVPNGGGGDAHQTGAGQGRAGEVPAVQGRLQRHEEGKGEAITIICHDQYVRDNV